MRVASRVCTSVSVHYNEISSSCVHVTGGVCLHRLHYYCSAVQAVPPRRVETLDFSVISVLELSQ